MLLQRILFLKLIVALLLCATAQLCSQEDQTEKKELSDYAKNFVGVWKFDTTKTRNTLKNIGIDSRAAKPIIAEQKLYMVTMHDDGTFEFRISRDLTGTGKWSIYEPSIADDAGRLTLNFDENEEIQVNVMQLHFQFDDTMKVLTLRPEKKNPFVVRRVRKITEKSVEKDKDEDNAGDGGI